MKRKHIAVIFGLMIATISLCGCTDVFDEYPRTMQLDGSGMYITVDNTAQAIILVVNGEHNNITLGQSVVIQKIEINGAANTIYVPKWHQKIVQGNVTYDFEYKISGTSQLQVYN